MKEMRFFIDTPSIQIDRLSENNDFWISFELKEDDFNGTLNFNIDPESIEWDTHDGEDEFPRNFNKLIVSLSTTEEISNKKLLEDSYFILKKYLQRLFRYIQIELGQYLVDIGPINDWSLRTFLHKTKAKLFIEGKEETIGISIGLKNKKIVYRPKQRQLPNWSDGLDIKQVSNIKAWIENNKIVALEKQLLADSKRILEHGDYKSSSVLAITALEGPLEKFVKARCKNKGIKKEHKTISSNLKLFSQTLELNELTHWLNIWVEEVKQWHVNEFKDTQIISWATKLNTARNKAVHEGISPEFITLDKGIFAVEAIYEFIKEGQ